MKGYTIQNSINLLEKEKGGGAGGASSADNISYDNTTSGLSAITVQTAIDELAAMDKYYPMDAIEHQIGNNLFIKHFSGDTTTGDVTIMEAFTGNLLHSYGYCSGAVYRFPLGTHVPGSNTSSDVYQVVESGNVNFETGTDSRLHYDIWVVYAKATEPTRTRKKK